MASKGMTRTARSVPALMDVARRAGVGAATVSRVINGGTNVSERTMAAVQRAIAELGYHPNQAARSLKGARTKTIGLIVPSVADPFFSAAAAVIQDVASQHGSLVLLAASENRPEREHEHVHALIQRRVDGLILAPSDGAEIRMFEHAGFPVVCFDRPFPKGALPTVLCDNYAGARTATQHLVEAGCRRILCLSGDSKLFTSKRRVKGYRDVVRAAGLPEIVEVHVQDYSSTAETLRPYLSGADRIDGVFSIKNEITVNAYKVLRDAKLKIPQSVALVGYDDFDLADALEPPICVVRQPVQEIARQAAESLFSKLEHAGRPTAAATLPVTMIHRASCGR